MKPGFNIDVSEDGWTGITAVSRWYEHIEQVLKSKSYIGYLKNIDEIGVHNSLLPFDGSIVDVKVIFRIYPQIEHETNHATRQELYRFITRYSYI